jgi:4a-hydroxytetrahydrobiopterin dehydratase
MTKLTGEQIAHEALDGWATLLGGLQTRIGTPDFATGLTIVDAIGAAAGQAGHDPEIDLRRRSVGVRLTSYDVRGVTDADVRLARRISTIAVDAGSRTQFAGVSRVELALDTPDFGSVLPFWGAVLAMEHLAGPDLGDELRDRDGVIPTLWFQRSGTQEPRQRWHPDVWVDPAEVQPRIDAAIAAGGTLVSDDEAPSFWMLADPDGNRVCLCTWQDR